MPLSYLLQSLLEASGKGNNDNQDQPADDAAEDTAAQQDTAEDTTDNQDADANPDDNTDDPKDDNKDQDNDDTKEDDQSNDDQAEDDFSMGDGEDTDDEPPPDGLVDPDDDGSGDVEEETETNVQTTILQLSKLDRTLAKRKIYNDFQELRTSITTVKNIVDNNEAVIEPETRDTVIGELDKLFSYVTDYMTIKFSITSYEENLQNYLLFVKSLQTITTSITDENGNVKKNKGKPEKS